MNNAIVVSDLQLKEAFQETGISVSEIRAVVDVEEQKNAAVSSIISTLREFIEEGQRISSQLRSITITDQDTHDLCVEVLRARKDFKERVEEFFEPMKKSASALHKTVCQSEAFILSGYNNADANAEASVRSELYNYLTEQERLQKKADAEAAEKQAKLDEQAREEAAKHAATLGAGPEAVQQIREAVMPVSPPKTAPVFNKSSKAGKRENWTWRYTSTPEAALVAIVRACIKGRSIDKRMLAYLKINESALTGDAKTKKSTADVPGVTFFDEGGMTIR